MYSKFTCCSYTNGIEFQIRCFSIRGRLLLFDLSNSFTVCPTFSERRPVRRILRQVNCLCILSLTSFSFPISDTNVRKEAVMSSIRSELALLNVQDLINVGHFTLYMFCLIGFQKASDKCFTKCILKPGTSLSSSDEVSVFFFVRNLMSYCIPRLAFPDA